ncbi:thioesterase II family protein [Catenulispora rubra]|uniref:thioesterase II family protein n=1 Tax=Catenulispora rubra TaxID=280293 RepID=UPI002B271184|nr:thioesterase domain-containing protein [Catenulispora rubra]
MSVAAVEHAAVDPAACLPFGVPDGETVLYCLPHAGASASVYRSWTGQLGTVAVAPIQLPGRETRMREAPYTQMAPLVDELADAVLAQQPARGAYAVYGHSLGALVGFELVREIRRREGTAPVHLIVSGCGAPDVLGGDDSDRPVWEMSDDEVVGLLRRLGGTPEPILADRSVRRLILPPFRGDLTVRDSYGYQPQPQLDVPITAIAATSDPRASVAKMRGWGRHTSRSFRMHLLSGGHFAVLEQAETTRSFICGALAG